MRFQEVLDRVCLTDKQQRVLSLLANGYTVDGIALRLEKSVFTIEAHFTAIREQLYPFSDRYAFVKYALYHRLSTLDSYYEHDYHKEYVCTVDRHYLTNAQSRVLACVVQGYSRPEVAAKLGMHVQTIDRHLAAIRQTLSPYTETAALTKYALRYCLTTLIDHHPRGKEE